MALPTLAKLIELHAQIDATLKAVSDLDLQLRMHNIGYAPYRDYKTLDYETISMFREHVGMNIQMLKHKDRADHLERQAKLIQLDNDEAGARRREADAAARGEG